MDISFVADLVFLLSIPMVLLLLKFYLPGYIKEKGKNLATKEDIADITDQIEQVKTEYSKQLELYKSDIWKSQQNYLLRQEEAKLKVEVFRNAVVDVAKLTNLIGIHQLHASNCEMAHAAAEMAHAKGNEEVKKASWDMYLDYHAKAATTYSNFRDVIVELGSTYALFSIYFDSVLTDSLHKVIEMGHEAIELKMTPAEFRLRMEEEYNKLLDLQLARDNVGQYYDSLWDTTPITIESNQLFQLMRNHIDLEGVRKV
jgi:hypothetical protein